MYVGVQVWEWTERVAEVDLLVSPTFGRHLNSQTFWVQSGIPHLPQTPTPTLVAGGGIPNTVQNKTISQTYPYQSNDGRYMVGQDTVWFIISKIWRNCAGQGARMQSQHGRFNWLVIGCHHFPLTDHIGRALKQNLTTLLLMLNVIITSTTLLVSDFTSNHHRENVFGDDLPCKN